MLRGIANVLRNRQATNAAGVVTVLANSGIQSLVAGATTTSETALYTFTVPAGTMGLNSKIMVETHWSMNNSANNKTGRIRFGGIGGTAFLQSTTTTNVSAHTLNSFQNRNSLSSQVCSADNYASFAGSSRAIVIGNVDTSAAFDIVVTGQCASSAAGEQIALESVTIFLLP